MNAKILCADDDPRFCRSLARTLGEEGFDVVMAHDGPSALALHREHEPDLAVLSVLLPGLDGFSLLGDIRKDPECGRIPVVLLSSCSLTPAYEERARELGAETILRKPVPLDRLLDMVRKQVGTVPVSPGPRRSGTPMLEGDLQEVPFPALLHHLHGLRATGVLDLKRGKKRKQIQLREGRVAVIRSNLVNETLGHLLAASGTITWDVMHESLTRVRKGEGLQGNILMAMQMLDEQDLARALHNQAEEKLFETFSWRKGRFRFHRGAKVKSGNALSLKRGTAEIVLDGVRLRTPIEVVDEFLTAEADAHPQPAETAFYRFQELELDDETREMMHRVEGVNRLGDILPLTEPERRLLYGLLVLQLVELRTTEARRVKRETTKPPVETAPETMATPEGPIDIEELRAELAAHAGRIEGATPYEILCVETSDDDDTIRKAYAALAVRTHPDRLAGAGDAVARLAEEVFGRIAEAYDAIRDEDSRRRLASQARSAELDAAELEEGHRALQAEVAFQKGEGALRARRYDEAYGHFEEAVKAYPEEGEYRAWFGFTHWLCAPEAPGQLEEAIKVVHAARKLAPDREKPYLFLGRLYKAADRMKQAEKMFTRAVQLDPDCVEALRELRLIHMRREKSRGLVRRILRR